MNIEFEFYRNISSVENKKRAALMTAIEHILSDAWGSFSEPFLESHIEKNKSWVLFAKASGEYVGFCSMSVKRIRGKKVHYIEFLAVKKEMQNNGLGGVLSRKMFARIFFYNFLFLLRKPLEVMFITPNVRVLANAAQYADRAYPDPRSADGEGGIAPADEMTWKMANDVIKMSSDPWRTLDREGLVLHHSYKETPWLIYRDETIPWHSDENINIFARRYLGYGKGEDKEFVVRVRFTLRSLVRHLFRTSKKISIS